MLDRKFLPIRKEIVKKSYEYLTEIYDEISKTFVPQGEVVIEDPFISQTGERIPFFENRISTLDNNNRGKMCDDEEVVLLDEECVDGKIKHARCFAKGNYVARSPDGKKSASPPKRRGRKAIDPNPRIPRVQGRRMRI